MIMHLSYPRRPGVSLLVLIDVPPVLSISSVLVRSLNIPSERGGLSHDDDNDDKSINTDQTKSAKQESGTRNEAMASEKRCTLVYMPLGL